MLSEVESFDERLTDWQVTIFFYSALHYLDAFFDFLGGIHPTNHTARNKLVANRTSVGTSYLRLYNRSLDARYNVVSFTLQEVDKIISDDFTPIRENIRVCSTCPS